MPRETLEIVIQEVLWSIRGSYSVEWPLTSYSDLPTDKTFHQFFMTLTPGLTFTDLRVVSTERLQQVWHANRERLSFRTPGSVPPFGDLLMLQLLRPVSPNLPCLSRLFTLITHGTFSILLVIFAHSLISPRWAIHAHLVLCCQK